MASRTYLTRPEAGESVLGHVFEADGGLYTRVRLPGTLAGSNRTMTVPIDPEMLGLEEPSVSAMSDAVSRAQQTENPERAENQEEEEHNDGDIQRRGGPDVEPAGDDRLAQAGQGTDRG